MSGVLESADLITTSQSSLAAWLQPTRIHLDRLDFGSAVQLLEVHAGHVDGAKLVVRACLGHPGLIKVCAGVLRLGVYPSGESLAAAVQPDSVDWAEQMGATVNHALSRIAERLPVGSRALFSRLSTLPFLFLARTDVSALLGGDMHLDNLVPLIEWHLLGRQVVDGLDVVVVSAFARGALHGIGGPMREESIREDTRLVSRGIVSRVSTALDKLRRRSILEALATGATDGLDLIGDAEADVAREWSNFLTACGFLIFLDASSSRNDYLAELVETLRATAFWQERGGQARLMLATVTLIAHASAELKRPFYILSARHLAGVCLRDLGFPELACRCFLSCIEGSKSEINLARARHKGESEHAGLGTPDAADLHGTVLLAEQAIVELARAIEDLTNDEFWALAHTSDLVARVCPDVGVALPKVIAAFNLRELVRDGASHMTDADGDVAIVEGLVQSVWNGTPDNALDLAIAAISAARESSRRALDIWGMVRLDVLERMTETSFEADSAPLAASMSFGATTQAAELAMLVSMAMLREGAAEREKFDVLLAFINAGAPEAEYSLSDEEPDGNAVLSEVIFRSASLLVDMGSMRSARRLAQYVRWFAAHERKERFTEIARRIEREIKANVVSNSVANDVAGLVLRGPAEFR